MTELKLRPPECVNLADADTDRATLSHTSLGTLLSCQERFNLHYEQRLRPTVTKRSLAMGRAFAAALDKGNAEHAWTALHAEAEKERVQAGPWLVVPSEEDVQIEAQIAREAARCYLARYGTHGQTRELSMRVRIRNPQLGGKVSLTHDLVCRADAVDLAAGLLVEDKLSDSRMRGNLEQRVRIDRQISLECYSIWRTTGVLITEVQFRVTLKPAIRRRKDESHDGFLDRIAEEYATRPEHYLVEPPTVTRTLSDFLRLERELWRWAEMVREARRDGTWPRTTGACLDYGGCVFLALCAGEPGADALFKRAGESQPIQEVAA